MSKVDKLNITGVRSFNAQRGETIQFYTPLTLIVGINGSGKTTTIECLKYATTGILPPGAKVGGAFIHDPKLLGEKEVMAQVKLQFKSAKGARMVVTRSLQLTVKKTTRAQKALEGSLLTEHNGEKNTISSKVADLDKAVPEYLGVSQAVLDNVIFCHQEDSLWPLSEPSNLKKKFDEIFEAQKYIKAIDNIKQIRKKHMEELGKYKILETHAKEDRDRAEKARKKSEELSDEIEELRIQCQDLEKKMEHARDVADQAWKQSESFARVLGALEGKKIEAASRQNTISHIKVHLQEMSESDEWLEQTLKRFEATMKQYEEDAAEKRERWLEWKDDIKELQDTMATKLGEKGKYEHDKEEYERQLDVRKNMVKEAAIRHHQRGYDDLADENLVEEFLFKIKKLFKDQSVALGRARSSADAEKQEAVSAINRLTARKTALQDTKGSVRAEIVQNDKEAGEFQRRVDKMQVDEGRKAVVESRIEGVEEKLRNAYQYAQAAGWEARLGDIKRDLRAAEEESSKLNAEQREYLKKAEEVAKLSHLKQELKEKQRSLQTLVSAHADRIKKLIGDSWSASDVEAVHRARFDDALGELAHAERERDAVAREIEQTQFKQKSVKDELTAKKAQVSAHREKVENAIGRDISEYDDALKEVQSQVEFARDEAKGIGGLADYFNKLLTTAKDRHMCRVCERPFKSPDDPGLVKMKKKLETLIRKAAVDSEEADLASAEGKYKQVFDAGIPLVGWKKLTQEEIPTLERELGKLDQQREKSLEKVEKHDEIVERKQSAQRDLQAVSRTVYSISKCEVDIQTLSGQIEDLSTKQSQQGNTRTLEDIQEEVDRVTQRTREAQESISLINVEQDDSKNQRYQLDIDLRDLRNELGTVTSDLEKKASLVARVEEFKVRNQQKRVIIEKTDKDIESLEPEILTAKAKQGEVLERWESQIATLTRDVSQLDSTVNSLNLLNNQIKSYVERGGPRQLVTVQQEIKELTQQIKDADAAQVQLTREMNKVEEQLRDSKETKRQYTDNLRYRQESRALDELQDEIKELSSRNADVDRDRFQEESKRFTDQYQKHSATREGCLGVMKTKDKQLEDLLKEYNTDLKDAPRRYKEAHIKVETTKAAVEDLARYGGALDKAIMKFHSIKMGQINEMINELWQKTYQGTDVDSIMIRSDAEATDANGNVKASASTASTRRQYNYRVTMSKQGVEMDMRGRCSAGQKVLACIIIRLALAEVFSVNCGLIALDEPTTNLDRDNIKALATSLHDIIKTRQQQSNFQLIVITHDEDFLRHMECGEFTDYYYRVSRDGDGDSIIERQDIAEVDR